MAQPCLPDGVMYNVDEQFAVQAGNDHIATVDVEAMVMASQPSSSTATAARIADLQGYQEGVHYTRPRPEIIPPSGLDIHELIVDTY